MIRFHVRFLGRVQGVGFRATTSSIARDFAVVGQVRNMPDGSVELIAEGEAQDLQNFVEAILIQMKRNVTRHTIDRGPATEEFGRPRKGAAGRIVIAH